MKAIYRSRFDGKCGVPFLLFLSSLCQIQRQSSRRDGLRYTWYALPDCCPFIRRTSACTNGPVIEDKHSSHVPGTALLSELSVRHGHTAVINTVAHKLKRGAGRDSHVVLNPQPSDDPRDPYVLSPDSSLTAKLTTL